eukprot:jgi/Botrbrau1/4301/Bobra.0390s0040.1
MSREIITLQFGGFANYVGAHYWNFQDEVLGLQSMGEGRSDANQVDQDVLYSLGQDARVRNHVVEHVNLI